MYTIIPRSEKIQRLPPNEYLSWLLDSIYEEQKPYWDQLSLKGYKIVRHKYGFGVYPDEDIIFRQMRDSEINVCKHLKKINEESLANSSKPNISAEGPEFVESLKEGTINLLQDNTERELLEKIPVAIAPIPLMNAGAGPFPNGGDFVLLNDGINQSALITLLIIRYIKMKISFLKDPSADKASEAILLSQHTVAFIIENFCDRFRFDPPDHPIYLKELPSVDEWIYITSLGNFQLKFILLHEYGHIVLGHTNEFRSHRGESQSSQQTAVDCAKRRQYEFAADTWALCQILPNCTSQTQQQMLTSALAYLFRIFRIIEDIFPSKNPELATHPPADERLIRILEPFSLDPKMQKMLEYIDKTCRDIVTIFNRAQSHNLANSRAKINPRPWNWEKSHEIG